MPDNISDISSQIKQYAHSIGFDACGICKIEEIGVEKTYFNEWLQCQHHAQMDYMQKNIEVRLAPTLLVENAKSIVCVALNYYPEEKQSISVPQIAYYAYGKDYHDVVKEKLRQLFSFIKTTLPQVQGRVFCDTAPLLERYWAAKAGVGFIGKNSTLILPEQGSYFFLGEIVIDQELTYDFPLTTTCGTCNKCMEACPTKALCQPYTLNANKCISYQTIENKGEIKEEIVPLLDNRLYGCDTCQQVCPWNKFAKPNQTVDFQPTAKFLSLDFKSIEEMNIEEYQKIFKGSAIKRAKYEGLKRNLRAIRKNLNKESN